jgi:hypothetical protein
MKVLLGRIAVVWAFGTSGITQSKVRFNPIPLGFSEIPNECGDLQ